MILYQLKAIGENACFDKLGANYSKRVFLTREEAEAYEPEFRSRCLTPQHTADLETLVNIAEVRTLELELTEPDSGKSQP